MRFSPVWAFDEVGQLPPHPSIHRRRARDSRGARNAQFEKTCAKTDPDSWLVFQAAMKPDSQTDVRPQPVPVHTAQAGAAAPPRVATDAFGVSPSGEVRGWVALMRIEPGKDPESHFDGYAVTDAVLPAAGSRLTSRRLVPLWREPLPPGSNPPGKLQGRLAAGGCVRVLSTRLGLRPQLGRGRPHQLHMIVQNDP